MMSCDIMDNLTWSLTSPPTGTTPRLCEKYSIWTWHLHFRILINTSHSNLWHGVMKFKRNTLVSTFNFPVFEDLIMDNNIQFSICLCKIMDDSCKIQFFSYDVWIRSVTCCFLSEVWITRVNVQYVEVQAPCVFSNESIQVNIHCNDWWHHAIHSCTLISAN